MSFWVTEESVKFSLNQWWSPLFLHFIFLRNTWYCGSAISETDWTKSLTQQNRKQLGRKATVFQCFHFSFKGFKNLSGAKLLTPYDMISAINSLNHQATLVRFELCWTFCNKFQVLIFQADLAQFLGSHFRSLVGAHHYLKCLALVN